VILNLLEEKKYCSNKCAALYRSKNPEYIKKLSKAVQNKLLMALIRVASRSKLEPSYAENM